jgi:hypothetical protein
MQAEIQSISDLGLATRGSATKNASDESKIVTPETKKTSRLSLDDSDDTSSSISEDTSSETKSSSSDDSDNESSEKMQWGNFEFSIKKIKNK